MKQILIIIISCIGFFSCQTNTETTQQEPQQNTEQAENQQQVIEIEQQKFDVNTLPLLDYSGTIVDGKRWIDANGENIILISREELTETENEESIEQIYAYQYVKKGNKFEMIWKVYDFMQAESWMDIYAKFIPQTLAVSDIDGNGIAETMFMYGLFAGTDVSPANVKLIMHEGDKKYALRGFQAIDIGGGELIGGDYEIDKAFKNAPNSFLDLAKKHWEDNIRVSLW